MSNSTGFNKKLRTSKREQGILTPKSPRYRRLANGKLECQCLFRGRELWQECLTHKYQRELDVFVEQFRKEQKEKEEQNGSTKESGATTKVQETV